MTRETRIDEIVLQHAAARGDQPTVLTDADEVTGLGLVALVAACRDALASAGVAGGDRVAVVAASRVTELAGLLAVMGGATAVPVPTDPPLEVARRHLVTSGATHVLDDGAPSTIAASTTCPRSERTRSSSAQTMPKASSRPPPPKSPIRLMGGVGGWSLRPMWASTPARAM